MVQSTIELDKQVTQDFVDSHWDSWFVPGLSDFIRVPNLTPMVDEHFLTNGLIEQAIQLVDDYVNKLEIKGLSRKIFKPDGMPPLVVYVIDGHGSETNLMLYGHLDKQPWMEPWAEGLAPTIPVIRGDLLFGRGGGDDGYAVFSSMLAIKNAQHQGVKWPRCVVVLETEEESGSANLIKSLDSAKEVIGVPDFLFCLDSGAFDYNHFWLTSSLRGICNVDITVNAAKGAIHSGVAGGIIPETFRVLRALLSRIDDPETGVVVDDFCTEIPEWAKKEAESVAAFSGGKLYNMFAMEDGVEYMFKDDLPSLYLNNTWKPNLAVTGAEGLPQTSKAGNVLRPSTSLRLSLRLPPNADPKEYENRLVKKLTEKIPHNCKVTVQTGHSGSGWCMKDPVPWLKDAF